MFLHSTREGDYPNQIQHPENIPHPLQTAGPEVNRAFNLNLSNQALEGGLYTAIFDFAIAGLYAEQNQIIFKVLASFLAGILKLMHHMVNLSNESGQA